jgi:tRNA pseudouridine13 synthase
MPQRQCHDLPAVSATAREQPEHTRVSEVLTREPSGEGDHLWVLVRKTGLSTHQARQAIARSVDIPLSEVSLAGARDRQSRCDQWFSLPKDLPDNPGALANAGYKKMLRVQKVVEHHQPISAASVTALQWSCSLVGGNTADGYLHAKAIWDRLRNQGFPNYIAASRMGQKGQLAKWGRRVAQGKRLPPPAQRERVDPRACLGAFQADVFNRCIATRLADGLLGTALDGDILEVHLNRPARHRELEVITSDGGDTADHCDRAQRRLESWEAVPTAPLFGRDCPAATGTAGARETALLAALAIPARAFAHLPGSRRAVRVQPRGSLDIERDDLVVSCLLDVDVYPQALLEEFLQPQGHLR